MVWLSAHGMAPEMSYKQMAEAGGERRMGGQATTGTSTTPHHTIPYHRGMDVDSDITWNSKAWHGMA